MKKPALEDPHTRSILAALGDSGRHFRPAPVSKNTLWVRRYRWKKQQARLAAARNSSAA